MVEHVVAALRALVLTGATLHDRRVRDRREAQTACSSCGGNGARMCLVGPLRRVEASSVEFGADLDAARSVAGHPPRALALVDPRRRRADLHVGCRKVDRIASHRRDLRLASATNQVRKERGEPGSTRPDHCARRDRRAVLVERPPIGCGGGAAAYDHAPLFCKCARSGAHTGTGTQESCRRLVQHALQALGTHRGPAMHRLVGGEPFDGNACRSQSHL